MNRGCFIFILAVFMGACAPKVQPRQFENPHMDFGPRGTDTDLREGLQQSSNMQPDFSWEGEVSSAIFFRQAENLIRLGQLTQSPAITQKGMQWIEKFYSSSQATSMSPLAESPYATAASTASKKDVTEALGDIRVDIEESRASLKAGVRKVARGFDWPSKPQKLGNALVIAEKFLDAFTKELPHMNLPEIIAKSISKEIQVRVQKPLEKAKDVVPDLYRSKTLAQTLKVINRTIDSFDMSLPAESRKMLASAQKLGNEIEAAHDEQGVLTAIVTIWKMLDDKERAANFKPSSEALYSFLKGQNENDLNCLATPGCMGGLINGIKKKVFVLPKIKQYGVESIRNQLNQATVSYALTTVETNAFQTVRDLPDVLLESLNEGLSTQVSRIKKIQKDYFGFLQDTIKNWARKKLSETKGEIAGFENPRVIVSFSDKSDLSLTASGNLKQVSNEVTGASFAALSAYYAQEGVDPKFVFNSSLSQINKLLALGGYRDDAENMIPAFFSPMQESKNLLDLMTFASVKESFASPDLVNLKSAFRTDGITEKNYSVAALTEQIRGLSSMLNYLKDWKNTHYNTTIGAVKASEVAEVQADELDRGVFPKDAFFALNVANVSVLMKNITKEFSQVFLLNTEKELIWANDYDFSGAAKAVMAGAVDIRDGKRLPIVKGDHVSRLLIAIAEFVRATEDIDQTTSHYLLKPDRDGVTPLELLKRGRDDLRMLTVALANFISHQMITKSGLVASSYSIGSLFPEQDASVLNQALAIRALIAARSITNLEIYIWSAQEIYFAMNKNLFSQEERFYRNTDRGNLGFPEKLTTLLAMVELYPHLPAQSQGQMDLIIKPWLKALSESAK